MTGDLYVIRERRARPGEGVAEFVQRLADDDPALSSETYAAVARFLPAPREGGGDDG